MEPKLSDKDDLKYLTNQNYKEKKTTKQQGKKKTLLLRIALINKH